MILADSNNLKDFVFNTGRIIYFIIKIRGCAIRFKT